MNFKQLFPWVVGLDHLDDDRFKMVRDELSIHQESINELFEGNSWDDNVITTFLKCKCLISRFNLTNTEEIINPYIKSYLESINFGHKNYKITRSWLNISRPLGFQDLHIHGDNYISGSLYIDCDENTGGIQFAPPLNESNLKQPHTVNPVIGDIVVFHGLLPHRVRYNKSQYNRISLSFNYWIYNDDMV